VASGGDGGLCEAQIEEVGNGGKRAVVAFHQTRRVSFLCGINAYGANFLFAGDVVNARGHFAGAFEICVGERD